MISPDPFENRLVYLLQTKLSTELSDGIVWDIKNALFDYGQKCVETSEKEKTYWRELALKKKQN